MSNRIGRFEIVSQLGQSPFATVSKAIDTESQQTVALKVVDLAKVKDRSALVKQVFEESDKAKPLNSHNIAALYGVGDEGDQLLASIEYVQGNSVGTTLARKDGFSIWDLQDIARQVCHALDHAHVHGVIHHSLEPSKIMVQWDGLVKVLGFGISTMNSSAMDSSAAPEMLHYSSPEQVRGEPCSNRSALFSLGAVLYEMATEQRAFPGETADEVRKAILESTPPLPVRLKANLNPGLSDLIMKALAKSPQERYQSGQDLVRDLENNKTSATKVTAQPVIQKAKAQAAAAGASAAAPSVSKPKITASAAASPAKRKFAVDPMMAQESENAGSSASFSEISELPPLKETYTPPSPSGGPELPEPQPQVVLGKRIEEKPKVQVREVAQKAVSEIRGTPPKLFLYAIAVAVVVIAAIVTGIMLHNYLEDRIQSDGLSLAAPVAKPAPAPVTPAAPAQPGAAEPAPAAETSQPQPEPEQLQPAAPELAASPVARKARGKKQKQAAAAVAGAELSITSTPAGAQIVFDGNALCQTPCTLTGIAPGQHTVSAAKSGYGSEARNITMASGQNGTIALQLGPLAARLSVASTPSGAVILVDGKDSGKLTPAVLTLEKSGAHTILLRRYGYLEQSASVNSEAGQTANLSLNLKALGNTEEIRPAGGKFLKVFGKGGGSSEMGIVSIKTQPKGAQITVNNRVLDKTSPFDFYLNPGTYVIDITMSGYRSVHRVINVAQQEKVAMEVTLSPE
jgi:serine/threonine-protein kinase